MNGGCRVRRYVINSGGLGDNPIVAWNPTTPALDCSGPFTGGLNRACWCLAFPWLCSDANNQAAYALAHPDVYAPIKQPPAVQPPANIVTPTTGSDPAATQAVIDAIIAQQKAAEDAQNQATMAQTAANLAAPYAPDACELAMATWPISLTCPTLIMSVVLIGAALLIVPRLVGR